MEEKIYQLCLVATIQGKITEKDHKKIPPCQDCGEIKETIFTAHDPKENKFLRVCSDCAKKYKITGVNYAAPVVEQQKDVNLKEEVVWVECPTCPNKRVAILKSLFDKDPTKYKQVSNA